MPKMVRFETIDREKIWVNVNEIAYVQERKWEVGDRGETSYLVLKSGQRFKVYGSPLEIMRRIE